MGNFVRTPWGIECFLCKTEFGYKRWMLLPSDLSDEEATKRIESAELAETADSIEQEAGQ